MTDMYYETIDKMEKQGVEVDYISGWAAGYLGHPVRGPQHTTPAYEAGYKAGQEKQTGGFESWIKK